MTVDRSVHAAPQSSLSLSMHNQQFSANIIRIPLEQVLHTISSYGPIRFVIKGDVEHDQVSSSFHHLSLEKSLEKLLVRYDFAIIHHQINAKQNTSEFPHLTEVVILSRNHSETRSNPREHLVISPSRNSFPPERVMSFENLENSSSLHPIDLVTEINLREFLEEVEDVMQERDSESLAFIKKILEE